MNEASQDAHSPEWYVTVGLATLGCVLSLCVTVISNAMTYRCTVVDDWRILAVLAGPAGFTILTAAPLSFAIRNSSRLRGIAVNAYLSGIFLGIIVGMMVYHSFQRFNLEQYLQ